MKDLARRLLRVFPARVRRRYGEEIVWTVAERVDDARRNRGRLTAFALAGRESFALIAAGVRLRLAEVRAARRPAPKRNRRGGASMDRVLHELRIAARGLMRRPAFTAVAVLAMALGAGANVAIFSVFHGVLLRPLPFDAPERLLVLWEKNSERGWDRAQVAPANYLDWREQSRSFASIAAYNDWLDEQAMVLEEEPVMVRASTVTGSFFEVLGVQPILGRVFDETHTWAGGEPAVVLSHGLWLRRFGGDTSVLGSNLELDSASYRILGVMPESFRYPFRDADLWLSTSWKPEFLTQVSFRRAHSMYVVGRLREDASIESARDEVAAIAARLELQYPETNRKMESGATGLQEWIVGDTRRPLQILMAAVLFVFLIACINVANMMLARDAARREEMRLRRALGGSRLRLLFQGLADGVLLGTAAGALGVLLGLSILRPILSLTPEKLPRADEIGADFSVVLVSFGVSLAGAVLVGLLSAWRSAAEGTEGLTLGPRGGSPSRSSRRATAVLVALEVSLSLPLVVGAGLMIRTLWGLTRIEPGFVSENVLVARVSLPSTRYDEARKAVFFRSFVESVAAIPEVESAGGSRELPFRGSGWSSDFTADGWPADRFGIEVRHDEATPGLFRTMRVTLVRGREFEWSDDAGAPRVVIVNQALADKYFPGEDPIGRRLTFERVADAESRWRQIVGVVANVRDETLALEEVPTIYAPTLQEDGSSLQLLMRSEVSPEVLVPLVRSRLRALDPALPLYDVTTLDDVVSASVGRERFLLALLAGSALVALALATIGIGGVVSQSTARRVREIGIRMALGAEMQSVVALVVREGMRPVVSGIGVGVVAAALLARAMSGLLFDVAPLDPGTFAGVAALVTGAALLACLLPARAAARVDASRALRSE
jgi:putative ABC transport system permease protein